MGQSPRDVAGRYSGRRSGVALWWKGIRVLRVRRSLGHGQAIPIEHPIEGSPVHPEDFSGPLFVSVGGCENATKVLLGQFLERGEGVRSEAGDWFRFVG